MNYLIRILVNQIVKTSPESLLKNRILDVLWLLNATNPCNYNFLSMILSINSGNELMLGYQKNSSAERTDLFEYHLSLVKNAGELMDLLKYSGMTT
jgi:hypothetical protein